MEELVGPLQEVFKDLRRQWKSFQEAEPFLHVVQGFIAAIDWREPWIIAILIFHLLMLTTAVTTRKRSVAQMIIFVTAAGITFMSERLNKLGAGHWRRFATQNYFDPTGVFMSAVVSMPLLLVLFIVLINYLRSCTALLVEAKKRELRHKAKQRAKEAKAAASAKDGTGAAKEGTGDKKKD